MTTKLVKLAVLVALAACNGKKGDTTPKNPGSTAKIDASLCESDGKRVVEYDLNKDGKADTWHLFKGSTVSCKQYDFDRDGRKDWVVAFVGANVAYQRADFDFGKFDMLAVYENGHVTEVERDTDFDGNFDVKEIYDAGGQVTSVRRDTNADTKPDIWEEYRDNVLVSISIDENFDGKVDKKDESPSSSTPPPTPPPVDPTPPATTPAPAATAPAPAATPAATPAKK